MAEEKNEFENLGETAPSQDFSDVPGGEGQDMIAAGSAGTKYDWTKAPEGVKAPPRIDLDGKTVTIKKTDIILPPKDREWTKSRDGTKEYKYCTFTLLYDVDGQAEFYSGVRVFKREEKDGEGNYKYSHPTIMRDRKNQASKLLGMYADFKKKDINEISLREFLAFLNSQPKAEIKVSEVKNPTNNAIVKKNLVGKFV